MNLHFQKLEIEDAIKIKIPISKDERGEFSRLFCLKDLESINKNFNIKQVNISRNKKGTLRGLHFQYGIGLESKIVICIKGAIFDVFVDLRKNSKTYKKVVTINLNKPDKGIYVPYGCAHGFQTLSDNCEILYLHSNFYNSSYEDGIVYNDKALSINWPLKVENLSNRDTKLQTLRDFERNNYEM